MNIYDIHDNIYEYILIVYCVEVQKLVFYKMLNAWFIFQCSNAYPLTIIILLIDIFRDLEQFAEIEKQGI